MREAVSDAADAREATWEDRCDWCGWTLHASVEDGCVADNCSMRPLPVLTELGAARQEIRALRWQLGDFMDYFRPHGGVSDVPLGPFERAQELLGAAKGGQS